MIAIRDRRIILFLVCLVTFHSGFSQGLSFNVLNYGAVNDGNTMDTRAIQKTIDDCAVKGGGIVNFPAGKYLSGTLILKSNIVLNLQPGAELIGSSKLTDYPPILTQFASYSSTFMNRSLIFAENLQHIGIIGQGKINGRGDLFPRGPEINRPILIRMVRCNDVTIRDISLEKPAMWTQHYLACERVTIDNIKVASWNSNANNDGIDIDCCDGVVISNSNIRSDDDAICLKSDSPTPCQNITITNCILSTASNGVKCGTDSYGGFENIVVSNCVINSAMLSGIALEVVDGGYMNNILISNIVMKDVNNPLFIRLGDRGRIYTEGGPRLGPGTMKNIKITNLSATGVGNFKIDQADKYLYENLRVPATMIGCPISGLRGHDIDNVSLTNISIAFKGGGKKEDADIPVPEKERGYPEYFMFGNLPSYAFFVRHVKGLFMQNVDVSYALPDYRPAVYMQDVKDGCVSDFKASCEKETECLFVMDSSRRIVIRDCNVPVEGGTLAAVKNGSIDLSFVNDNVIADKQARLFKEDAKKRSDIIIK